MNYDPQFWYALVLPLLALVVTLVVLWLGPSWLRIFAELRRRRKERGPRVRTHADSPPDDSPPDD